MVQSERVPPFSLDQIGRGTVRFPSGAPIPSASDIAVDPYAKTRTPKEFHVEGLQFWPQLGPAEKTTYPGVVLLHEAWGLNDQIKNLANRLACEGYAVLVPNLYGRQGGMVTANAEVAQALAARMKEADTLQDINSCCEYLNTRDHVLKNVHAVVGFGLGGSLALRFACQRKRLRAAVAFYANVTTPPDLLKDLICPVLYHRAGADPSVSDGEISQLERAAKDFGKKVEIETYAGAPHAFSNETRKDSYRADAAAAAWERTVAFLNASFEAAR